MSILKKISDIQKQTKTMLCIGLDTDIDKLPKVFARDCDAMVQFNRAIIEATQDLCCAYKINFAFYERYGVAGVNAIERTLALLPQTHVCIADAKRGDIGNTSEAYAKAILVDWNFDAVTVHPYMGADSVEPFLAIENKLVFLLALTSNSGSADFQYLDIDGKPLYQYVMAKSQQWKRKAELGYVVGATHPSQLSEIRSLYPEAVLLIPGVGTQGGNAGEIQTANAGGTALVNASRAILYASAETDFTERAREKAVELSLSLKV